MLDVTELFSDPDFCGTITIYRRLNDEQPDGRNRPQKVLVVPRPIGSVQPGANPEILRNGDFQTNAQIITVYTKFHLHDQNTATWPDIVCHDGAEYEVKSANTWAAWGPGWTQAICESIETTEAGENDE